MGGIIPASDARALIERGVAAVYTPKDFGLTEIMGGFVDVIRAAHGLDDPRLADSPAMRRVIVVGAGVIGLSCAVRLLEAGHRVDVVGRDLPLETTSSVAAAVWSPYSRPQEHVVRWSRAAYDAFAALCERRVGGRASCAPAPSSSARRPADLWWRDALPPGAGPDRETSLPAGYAAGLTMRTPVVEMPVYLRWLAARVEELGGTITRMNLSASPPATRSWSTPAASGRASSAATRPSSPVRGQVVLVEQVGLDHWWIDAETPSYVVPRSRDVVLGGTALEGEWSRTPEPATAESILERASPDRAAARRRPGPAPQGRPAAGAPDGAARARVGDVIHCYGHGGCGVTVSWGCADDVVGLVDG